MKTEEMRDQLYEDYRATRLEWQQALGDLAHKLVALNDARRRLAELKDEVTLYQHTVVIAETHTEGRINGKNAETRKRQTELMLADLPNEDPDYASLIAALEKQQTCVDELECDIEILRQKISFLRNQSKMVSGLAHALAG